MPRVKCSILDRNKEKVFSRIATRGVVKFFNVCSQEQKDIESKIVNEAGSSERKRDRILGSINKGSFLDRLKESNFLDENDEAILKTNNEPTWSVLKDDFIMSSKIKDWDKEAAAELVENETEENKKFKKHKNNKRINK